MELEIDLNSEAEKDIELRYALNKLDTFRQYYQTGFPFFKIYRWLAYANMTKSGKILDNNKDYFKRREISYMKVTEDSKDEFVIRHLCFENDKAF
jgi:DNA primase small subunit